MSFIVQLSPEAVADMLRLQEFLLQRAQYREDLEIAERALAAIHTAIGQQLAQSPLIHRKAGDGKLPLRRELLIPFAGTGYLALYDILPPDRVLVLAVRHLLEQDYY